MNTNSRVFRLSYLGLRLSLAALPYLLYASLVGLSLIILFLLPLKKITLDPLTRNSLLVMSGLMMLSSWFALNRGEAFLQLTNFFPFFLLFGVLPFLLRRAEQLEQIAIDLVIASIPINFISAFEYLLKAPWLPRDIQRVPFVRWVRSAPHKGRAMLMFNHPNALANYLVLMLGLGLGLILKHAIEKRFEHNSENASHTTQTPNTPGLKLLYTATFLTLVGIFCSGSRNGLMIAVSQLIVFSLLIKTNRTIRLVGVLSLVGTLTVAALLGIGGRSLSPESWANDPRLRVWQIAIELIQERPWLGWGLGNYKFLYPSFPHDPEYDAIFHPHNFWLLLSSEAGIPLMIIFTFLVGYICYQGVRLLVLQQIKSPENILLAGYLLAFWGCIAFALFDVTLFDARINVVNWMLLGGIYSFTRQIQSG
jgi:O-antigen ligase